MAMSHYERLGGCRAVESVTDLFFDKIAADPGLARFIDGLDTKDVRNGLAAFLAETLGGPETGLPEGLDAVRGDLQLTSAHFCALLRHLVDAFEELGAPRFIVDDVSARVSRLEPSVCASAA